MGPVPSTCSRQTCVSLESQAVPLANSLLILRGPGEDEDHTHLSWSGGAWGEAQRCGPESRRRGRSLLQTARRHQRETEGRSETGSDSGLLLGLCWGSCTQVSKATLPLPPPTSRIQNTRPVPVQQPPFRVASSLLRTRGPESLRVPVLCHSLDQPGTLATPDVQITWGLGVLSWNWGGGRWARGRSRSYLSPQREPLGTSSPAGAAAVSPQGCPQPFQPPCCRECSPTGPHPHPGRSRLRLCPQTPGGRKDKLCQHSTSTCSLLPEPTAPPTQDCRRMLYLSWNRK